MNKNLEFAEYVLNFSDSDKKMPALEEILNFNNQGVPFSIIAENNEISQPTCYLGSLF
ncbi:hypothetical protein [Rickettsia australis]|uniref:hypothetical protein n=1 Tax=Rickettsia australis TaxID=787 RepID=UPI00031501E0|nr:hypothetical protein [Rickettsia australis]